MRGTDDERQRRRATASRVSFPRRQPTSTEVKSKEDNYPGSYSDSHRGSSSSSSSSSLNYGSSKLQLGTAKMEEDLSITVKKALSPDEAAPKQKHVRACILYTWDIKGSGSLWRAMQSFPMLGDEVIIFKALVTTHKIINQGHPGVCI